MSGSILTTIGLSKISSSTPLDQLNVTEIAVGDGNGSFPTLSPSMTSLVNEVWRDSVSAPVRDENDPSILIFEGLIPAEVGGFTMREIAIFDDVGDMIAIGHTSLIVKPNNATEQGMITTVRISVKLNNASDVDVIYQDSGFIDHQGLLNKDAEGAHPASAIVTKTSGSAQDFIDSFALEIFQSPTDGLTKIRTRTLLGGEVYEIRKVSDGSLATIYSDAAGATEIAQNGANNISDSDGVVEFYIADGDYYIEVDSVKSNFKALNTSATPSITLSDLKKTNFKVGSYVKISDRAFGVYKIQPIGLAANDMDRVGLENGLVAEYQIIDGRIYLDEIGAKATEWGDYSKDSVNTSVLNRAFELSSLKGDPLPSVHAGYGVYYVDGQINKVGSGNYTDFYGQGQRNTVLSASPNFVGDSVLKMGIEGEYTGRTKISDMTISAANMANYALDCKEMRYFYQDNLELLSGVIACQIAGNWVIHLNNTKYAGRVGLIHEGTALFRSSSNNFTVTGGDFTGCSIGVITTEVVNDITFSGCNFDACEIAAYKAEKGVKSVRFLGGCTFERCGVGSALGTSTYGFSEVSSTLSLSSNYDSFTESGYISVGREIIGFTKSSANSMNITRGEFGTIPESQSAGVQLKQLTHPELSLVRISSTVYETALAPIVLSYIYNNLTQTSSKLHLADSVFNNTAKQAMVIMYNCKNALIDESVDVLEGYNYDSFVELRGFGSNELECTGLKIVGKWVNVSKLVEYHDLPQSNRANISVDNGRLARGAALLDITDPTTADFTRLETGDATINKARYMGYDEYEFDVVTDGTSLTMGLEIDFTECTGHPILGRYLSFSMMNKGDGAQSGVRVTAALNGVTDINILRLSEDNYIEAGRRYTMYVPSDAQTLSIRVAGASNTVNGKMIGFRVCDSALI